MATNIQAYGRFAVRINGQDINAGSLEIPSSIEVTGDVHSRLHSIANAANTLVWSNELNTFVYLFIQSDYDLRMQFTDTNSDVFSLWVRGTGTAGKLGLPFQLGLDDTSAANTVVNAIRLFNTSGSAARARVIIIK